MSEAAIYAQVAVDLRARIKAGEFVPGQRLGSEGDLAHEYGVSHTTIGSAIRLLRGEGLLEPAVPGRAAVVREQPQVREVRYPRGTRITGRPATVEDAARSADEGIEPGVSLIVAELDGEEHLHRADSVAILFY